MTLFLLGSAALLLALGGVAATVALWDLAPTGARVAMTALDAALVFYVLAVFAAATRTPAERKNLRHNNEDNPPQRRDVRLKAVRQLASELNTTLVRRRDGTYYLKLGPLPGRIPINGKGTGLEVYNSPAAGAATYDWLPTLADTLDAELLYDGKRMEWYLHWPDIQEADEEES